MPVSSPALMNPTAEFPKRIVASVRTRAEQSVFVSVFGKKKKGGGKTQQQL